VREAGPTVGRRRRRSTAAGPLTELAFGLLS